MFDDFYKLVILGIIALLLLWLVYRIRNLVRHTVKTEIFDNLPSIKHTIDNFEHRIINLTTQVELLERKIKEIEDKLTH
jgi:hypothetical protein